MIKAALGHRLGQRGVAAVEFALVSVVFFMFLFGAIEVARVLWVWNAASEVTRFGARMAVVCGMDGDTQGRIKDQMVERLGLIGPLNIKPFDYQPAGCNVNTCQSVTVELTGYQHQSFIPFVNFRPTLPPFRTTLSREYLTSIDNPACS